jgi:uncharacterized membrane protein
MLTALANLDGFMFILRWLHFFFGVVWIGHLYYFNFVQGPFFNETDASTKSNATQKLVPRALWWFRWGAFWTLATGLVYLSVKGQQMGGEFLNTSYGLNIMTGAVLGILMAANVWFVIWPNQKVVIQSATQVAQGGQPIAEAAARAARAGVASRTNVLFSIPMLFFMGAASHLGYQVTNATVYLVVAMAIILGLEVNALKGKMGPMTTIKGVITSGFALTALFVLLLAFTQ